MSYLSDLVSNKENVNKFIGEYSQYFETKNKEVKKPFIFGFIIKQENKNE